MKTIHKLLSLAILGLGLPLFAQGDCENNCSVLNGIEFGIDLLWWKPCASDLGFGYTVTNDNTVLTTQKDYTYHKLCPDWSPGVRVSIGKPDLFCNLVMEGSYTFIKPTDSNTFSNPKGGYIYGTLTDSQTAARSGNVIDHLSADWNVTYQTFDVLIGYPLEFSRYQYLTSYFGIAGLFLSQSLNSHGTHYVEGKDGDKTINLNHDKFRTRWESDLWALGLKLGTAYEYYLCDGFKLIANGSTSIVSGQSSSSGLSGYDVNTGSPFEYREKFHDDKNCRCIVGWHIQVSAMYETCWWDKDVYSRVGYEFVQWINLPNARRFLYSNDECIPDAFEGRSTLAGTGKLGFNGLFVGVGIKY